MPLAKVTNNAILYSTNHRLVLDPSVYEVPDGVFKNNINPPIKV